MKKSLIQFRKVTWLPVKFFIKKTRLLFGMSAKSKREVYNRLLKENENLLAAERKRISDLREIEKFKTIINTLEWFLNIKG